MTARRPVPVPAPPPDAATRLRVLYLIDSLGRGGAEHLLVRYLQALPAHGVDPVVVAIQERDGNPLAADVTRLGVPFEMLHIRRLRERGALRRVDGALARHQPHLVHTQLEFANILGTIAARRRGIPAVATLHTIDRPARWSRDAAHFRLMAHVLTSRGARVIAVSRSAADHFSARSAVARRLVTTIHNGIDLSPFLETDGAARAGIREALGLDPSSPVLVTVAVLRPPKGIDDLVAALPAVLTDLPDTHLLIVGDGPARSALERTARDHEVSSRVHFLGHRTDVESVLAAADLFVLPSHTEALPTVVIEAMAAGLPVVATEVGGIPEMVDRGGSALLVPPHRPDLLSAAIVRVLTSPLQARAMGITGRRLARARFDLARQVGELVAEYRRVLAEGATP